MSEPMNGICGKEIQNQRAVLNDPWHVQVLIPERILYHVRVNEIFV